ncbi:hypothetical protein [Streptomyces anulatus]|uniref:hypothetical protein n=1 Tax=Streptomyces anulatus TaxID=1892 RepID=UPI0037DC4A96|nr:hypothetical protein OHB50_38900 [Streptomyces anulatus]
MASTKTTYSTTHPTTGETVTFTKGGRPIQWITWGDLGNGFVHFGFSSQEEYKKALRAPRSSNPHATRYEATAATVVEDKPAEQPQHENDPTPVSEEGAPAPVVTPDEVADVLDRIVTAHADIVQHEGPIHLSDAVVHYEAHGLSWKTDDDTFGARRAELRQSGRLPHVRALITRLRQVLTAHLGDAYVKGGDVTPDQIRRAADTVRLAARYPVASVAAHGDAAEEFLNVVVVGSEPDQNGTVQVHSVRLKGPVRVPLAELRPAPELPPHPPQAEGEITDWWTITDVNGAELTRVQAEDDPGARKVALRNKHVTRACHRDNGFGVRRLRTSELATPVGELPGQPRVSPAAAPARTVTVTTGFTRKSIPTRLRESGAPGRMVNSEAAGGAAAVAPAER